tara:strand:+ start:62 stop:283 length:222 start_codon:yes stop_codon:yes gene_type:complete
MATFKVTSTQDSTFLQCEVGDVVQYPCGSKAKIIFKMTDKIGNYFFTQMQTNNIKKNGEIGKLTTWLKFKHYY